MITRTIATALAAVTAAAALAGCGSASGPTPTDATPSAAGVPANTHNQTDITFATAMVPHHVQAVAMSKLAADHASSPQVKNLAGRIESAQRPEIDQLSGLLRSWNAPVPATQAPGTGAMDGTGHADMAGMMSEQQMQQLGQTNGAAFDKMFLQMMINHHEGAVSMAKTERNGGQSPDARGLAQRIMTAQQREIAEMHTMLAPW
jgi:uncharacterized protein (DUF305 family)